MKNEVQFKSLKPGDKFTVSPILSSDTFLKINNKFGKLNAVSIHNGDMWMFEKEIFVQKIL